MMNRLGMVAMILVLFGCSKGTEGEAKKDSPEPSAAKASEPDPDTRKAKDEAPATDNPCELLTEAMVRKHLKIADDVEVKQKLSMSGFPHCSYHWSTLTPEEEAKMRKEAQERALASIRNRHKKGKGKGMAQGIADLAQKKMTGRGSASLTMTKEMISEDSAVKALDAARSYMEKRAKAKVGKGESVDFTSPTRDVEGIGSKAFYSEKQRQISFVYGKRLYHLGATPDREGDSLEIATAIAKEIFPQ